MVSFTLVKYMNGKFTWSTYIHVHVREIAEETYWNMQSMFSSHENKLVRTTSSLVSSMEATNLQCDMMSQKVCECTWYADYFVLSMWTPHSFPHLRVISIHLKNAKYTWKVNCLQQTQIWSHLQIIYSIGLKHCRSVRTYIHVYVYAILSERCFLCSLNTSTEL